MKNKADRIINDLLHTTKHYSLLYPRTDFLDCYQLKDDDVDIFMDIIKHNSFMVLCYYDDDQIIFLLNYLFCTNLEKNEIAASMQFLYQIAMIIYYSIVEVEQREFDGTVIEMDELIFSFIQARVNEFYQSKSLDINLIECQYYDYKSQYQQREVTL